MADKEKLYKWRGLLWQIIDDDWAVARCMKDNCDVRWENEDDVYDNVYTTCPKCGNKVELEGERREIIEDIIKIINSDKFKGADIVNLDDEYITVTQSKKEDDDYWVRASISENRKGETQLMVLAGSRKSKNKTQLFIDPQNERVSFDQNNDHPREVFSKVNAIFKKSSTLVGNK
ncbi:MAG: hypothetical protein UT34_C0001G0289 [candidate division WS6 bacterium GW2011_GWF2_39_15]|uniref:Uncharacterized protein n=1 Tax=candidate division WS6 bacterium GW2011_GWF2_39_15 TaxID=1619100 RepID=A0A0G0MQD9_9BACT|nr:MAG: hypothetical protein UT34_C0001G0289 [candidate division WS6 bacterium GW2011_GWF2_39_15]